MWKFAKALCSRCFFAFEAIGHGSCTSVGSRRIVYSKGSVPFKAPKHSGFRNYSHYRKFCSDVDTKTRKNHIIVAMWEKDVGESCSKQRIP